MAEEHPKGKDKFSSESNYSENQDQKNTYNKWQKISEESANAAEKDDNNNEIENNDFDQDSVSVKVSTEQTSTQESLDFVSRADLENRLTATEMKCDEYKLQCLRAQAELNNVQRRAQRDIDNAYKYSTDKLLTSLLPVLDSLTHALGTDLSEEGNPPMQAMKEGIRLTLDLFQNTLAKFGVTVIDPVKGSPFNPLQHEAVSIVQAPDLPTNSIVEVLQKGYLLNDRVIRATMVVVSQ